MVRRTLSWLVVVGPRLWCHHGAISGARGWNIHEPAAKPCNEGADDSGCRLGYHRRRVHCATRRLSPVGPWTANCWRAMESLTTCNRCGGFLPRAAIECPNCSARPRAGRVARRLLKAASGGAVALTLMACYGGAPQYYNMEPAEPTAGGRCDTGADDIDGDGYCSPEDCDEVNADIHPEAGDPPGDGVDQNCDGSDGPPSQTIAEEPS
jgi:hypothetical protein